MVSKRESCGVWWLDQRVVHSGAESYDALSCRSFIAKEPQIMGLFCGKRPLKIWHPMTLRHPVSTLNAALPGTLTDLLLMGHLRSVVARHRQMSHQQPIRLKKPRNGTGAKGGFVPNIG